MSPFSHKFRTLIPFFLATVPLPLSYVMFGIWDIARYRYGGVESGVIEMMGISGAVLLLLIALPLSATLRGLIGKRSGRMLCYSILPIVWLLTLVEVGCGLVLRVKYPETAMFGDDRLNSSIFKEEPWAYRIVELGKQIRYDYAPIRLWKARGLTDKLMNIDAEGCRRTVNPPPVNPAKDSGPAPEFHVQVYGGSTVFCTEVPDWLTMPSQLARELAQIFPDRRVIVKNCGVSGYVRAQQVAYLTQELQRGPKPDLVIFYDGANDLQHPLWLGVPHDLMSNFQIAVRGEKVSLLSLAGEALRHVTNVGRLDVKSTRLHSPSGPEDRQKRVLEHTTLYLAQAQTVRDLCAAQGIQTAFFLQPLLYQKATQSIREQTFADFDRFDRVGIDTLYADFSREVAARESAQGHTDFHDLTLLFRDRTEELYLDTMHVGPEGNAVLARAIAEDLAPSLR